MPIWVSVRAAPKEDGDACPVFNPAVWWKAKDLMEDPRFRVTDRIYWYSIACLDQKDMRELQERFRPRAQSIDHWRRDSDRLDALLADRENSGRWWVVTVYEWESGLD